MSTNRLVSDARGGTDNPRPSCPPSENTEDVVFGPRVERVAECVLPSGVDQPPSYSNVSGRGQNVKSNTSVPMRKCIHKF